MSHLFSPDARQALGQAGFTRRSFLKGSGAIVVAFSSSAIVDTLGQAFAQGINGTGSTQLDSWIAIGRDGLVTAYTGKCEFGQGLYTAQLQLVAEEVCVPMNRIRLVQCDTSVTPDQGTTSGQQSHPSNFNTANLALAGATAREALIRMASAKLGVPPADLVARDGLVALRSNPSRSIPFGDLIGGQRFDLQLDRAATRKHPREWTVLGTSVPRVDMRDMVT
ncbi:MAG TPA: molybdopterin cofactor-binding domain-containing protein, partial [Vicinamibacterales bacterium]|nr:molybdopterin cofactor-binding domain-containing protein [Vicinamibacterales bacterium]